MAEAWSLDLASNALEGVFHFWIDGGSGEEDMVLSKKARRDVRLHPFAL